MTTVEKIESYGVRYNPDSGLCLEDQLLACEAIAESRSVIEYEDEKGNPAVNNQELSIRSSSSSACYPGVNDDLARGLLFAIEQLKELTYRSSRYKIAEILQSTFGNSIKPGHWFWCAQNYCPRPIIRTLTEMHSGLLIGKWNGETPSNFFTFLLKKRSKRTGFKKKEVSK